MPSTAFCLLVRLFTLRCSEKQMNLMLDHVDSPYIRCIGFLYLRYAAEPKTLWQWYEPYLYDEEKVRVEANTSRGETTVGAYIRSLLTNMDYYGTKLPRLPVAIEREIKVKLLQAERTEDRAQKHWKNSRSMDYFQKLGNRVRALYGDDENPVTWYDAVIDRVITRDEDSGVELSRPKFVVTFPEYGNTETVTLGDLDFPGAGSDSSGERNPRHVGGQFDRKDRREGHGARRGYLGREDGRGSQVRGDRPHYRADHGGSGKARGEREWNHSYGPDENESQLMEEVLRQEREKITATGRAYASRPPSCKTSLSEQQSSSGRKRPLIDDGDFRPVHRQKQAPSHFVSEQEKPLQPSPPAKTPEELAAIQEKKRKLMAKYG